MAKEKSKVTNAYFDEQYRLYHTGIYKFCMAKLNCNSDLAEDCTQETFVVFYNRVKQGEAFDNPRAFLYKTALNFVKKAWHTQQSRLDNEIPIDTATSDIVSDTDSIESRLDYAELEKRIGEILTDDEMQLFTLRFIDGRMVRDIAHDLDILPTACATRLMRIRNKIKDEINKYL